MRCSPFGAIGGFSFGVGGRVGKATFDPATLSLSGWWRGSFSASPWAGVASAGSSGGRDLSEGTNPPASGTAVNGFNPADFDGTNDRLTSALTLGDFFSASAWSVAVLFNADTAGTDNGATNIWKNPPFFIDTNEWMIVGFSAGGFQAAHYNSGGNFGELSIACGTGGWHLGQAKFGGGVLKARIDSGSWSSSAGGIGNLGSTAGTIRAGENPFSSARYDGKILDMMTANTELSDAAFDNILSYARARYGLSL